MTTLDDAREGMNPDIRPQDDLFGHVNGRWLDETEIPSDRSSWGPFVQLADIAEEQVHAIIEELARRVEAGEDVDEDARKIGDLFASFMDVEAIAAKGTRPIRPLLAAVEGLRDVRDLAAFLGEFERIGGHGLFGSYVDTDSKNSDRYLFNLVQGGLGLPDESYYRDDKFAEVRDKYVAYLDRLFTLADHDDPAGAAATVLAIDTRLAAGHWERAETRDVQKTYNLMTKAELVELCPTFDWDAFVTNLGGSDETLAEVCVRQPSYFSHLSGVLEEVGLDEWRQWLLAHVLRATAGYLTDDFVETNFDFYGRTLNGTPELRARWKRGVALVEGAMGEAVGKEYVARHFPPHSKAMMDELVANLLAAYRQSISKLDWMTDETKQRAFEKLDTFRPKIGYPEKFRDYSRLQVTHDDLLGNVAAASAFETDRQLAKIGAPVDRDEWFMLPQTVNAYYNQRDLLPRRDPAEAVLLPGGRGGRELRRHRRGDRPRDRSRVRRPGGAVRRRRQPPRLVDARRQGGVRGEVEGADRAVRRLRAAQPPRRAGQRRAHRRREHRRPRRADDRPHGVPPRPRRRGLRRGPAAALPQLGLLLADQAPQGAGPAVPHDRPAQPAGVPRQHRAQPRRVPRGVRDVRGRRALARPGRPRPHLVGATAPAGVIVGG